MAPILCYVTDRKSFAAPETASLPGAIHRAADAGVDWIQIREKDLSGRELAALAREAVVSARGSAGHTSTPAYSSLGSESVISRNANSCPICGAQPHNRAGIN